MSFVLHLTRRQPPSKTDPWVWLWKLIEAQEHKNETSAELTAVHDALMVEAAALVAATDEVDEATIWRDGPTQHTNYHAEHAIISPDDDFVQEILDAAVRAGAQYGVTVWDMQEGVIYLPNGRRVTENC
ncbi:SIMPL domain-containing protein [Allohahella marinimesophila]|uniref:Uncharacterized protein n=1 Tax=Allohahella marinimesophila TaxID=1054972 RepID=A0ABP7P720_9GAMM